MEKLPRTLLRATVASSLLFWAVASHAQSQVTLYGLLDGALLYTSKTANATGGNAGHQFSVVTSGQVPTLFGLTGTEDLGGGYQAKFKLESGFSVANGGLSDSNGNFFGRQAYITLVTPYGQTAMGVQFSPFFLALFDTDAREMGYFGSGGVILTDLIGVTSLFNSNSISYTSPNIYGFTGSALLALGGKAGDFQAGRQYSASLKYVNGAFLINAAVYSGNAGGTVNTPIPSTVEFWGRTIGATYSLGALTLKAQFVNYKVAQSFNANVYSAGFNYYATPSLNFDAGVWYTSDRNNTENHSILGSIGTTYSLTRRTALYSQVAVVNNHGAMDTGLSVIGALYGTRGTTVGANVGIRHLF